MVFLSGTWNNEDLILNINPSLYSLSRSNVFGCCLVQAEQNWESVLVHPSLFFSKGYVTR